MSSTDEMINAWLKEKFLDDWGFPKYSPVFHGEPDEIEVISSDMDWECDCMSEFTRADTFQLTALIRGVNGVEIKFRYGNWGDMPQFIEELDAFKDNEACYYESSEYQG